MGSYINMAMEIVRKDILLHYKVNLEPSDLHLIDYAVHAKSRAATFFTCVGEYKIYTVYYCVEEDNYYVNEYTHIRTVTYRHKEADSDDM